MNNQSASDIRENLRKQRERWMRERELNNDRDEIMQNV